MKYYALWLLMCLVVGGCWICACTYWSADRGHAGDWAAACGFLALLHFFRWNHTMRENDAWNAAHPVERCPHEHEEGEADGG